MTGQEVREAEITPEVVRVVTREWRARVKRLGLRPFEADDAYADALLGAWDACRKYAPGRGASLATFAGRLARCRMADGTREALGGRARGRRARPRWEPLGDDPLDRSPPPESPAEREDWWSRVLAALTPRQAQVMARLYRDGYTPIEVARQLGVTDPVVHEIRHHALARLRVRLASEA